jgi:hypothetical protein
MHNRKGGIHAHATISKLARLSIHDQRYGRHLPKPQTPDGRCRIHRLLRNHLGSPRTLEWLWRDTTFEDKTVTRTVGAALVLSSFFFYLHLRRGFGAFFLILTSTGIGIAIRCSNHPMIHRNRSEMPAIVLVAIGLIAYFAQTRYLPGFLFLLASSGTIIGIIWFNPALFCPIVMVIAGSILIFLGMLIRSLAIFNSFM